MLSYTWKRGFIQWVLDGKEYTIQELKDMKYCLTFWDWKSIDAELSRNDDLVFRQVMRHNLKLIYQITFH